ncbi:MAG: CopY family transcriptional regulator [Modestobacter sp.]|jgi:predicted transcriptional regulator|nr:CopY family transcriptional regulator [Modestobacter sp.]
MARVVLGHRRERGDLENEVLATLAAAKRPLTPREVLAQLERELACTTVMTTLARLHAKDAVTRQRVGRAYAYAYADGATVAARRMRRVLDGGDDRTVVLARFLGEREPGDVPVLQRLLAEAEAEAEAEADGGAEPQRAGPTRG